MGNPLEIQQKPRDITDLLSFKDFLPEFRYEIKGVETNNEKAIQFHEEFLRENYELILQQMMNSGLITATNKEIYLRGFRDCMAVTQLWLSSLNQSGGDISI